MKEYIYKWGERHSSGRIFQKGDLPNNSKMFAEDNIGVYLSDSYLNDEGEKLLNGENVNKPIGLINTEKSK